MAAQKVPVRSPGFFFFLLRTARPNCIDGQRKELLHFHLLTAHPREWTALLSMGSRGLPGQSLPLSALLPKAEL